ncbi:MAG: type II secretion system protein [Candidatus Omnitrophica bacterium]|nr:type II secretion system protein [Candidatus Omnitrophota bacterium]
MQRNKNLIGFTLIELLISIAIAGLITAVIYFSFSTALDIWEYSSDQLALQKVLGEAIDETANGTPISFGLRSALEIKAAGPGYVEFVPPWTDDIHRVVTSNFIYTLNRKIKPGTALPIGEVKLPETEEYRFISVVKVESEDTSASRVKIASAVPVGSQLRFTYHPDSKANADVVKTIRWDAEKGQIYSEYKGERLILSRNPFGVKITDMRLRYYDNTNNPITSFEWVDMKDLSLISGVEIFIEARLGQYSLSLINFANLRNAPLHSGYFLLSENTRIPIPDSRNVHTLLLSNFSGVSNGDILQIEATPHSGKSWRLKVEFGRRGLTKPIIESYTIEYPVGYPIYTEYPRSGIDLGLNLLTIGANGLYDYDDDADMEDFVLLEGEVMLEVKSMDIDGAGLFVRP